MAMLIVIPKWSTFGILAVVITQLIMSWLQAKKTGKGFRAILPQGLIVAAGTIIFVREFFTELPLWIDASLAILCFLLVLTVCGLWSVRLKRYLKEAWRLEEKKD